MIKYNEKYIVEEYSKGRTQKDIANELGTYNTSIRRILIRNNVPIRGNSIIQSYLKGNPFSNLDDPTVQYWLGWLTADGCLTNGAVVLSIKEEDKYILEEYSKFLGGKVKVNNYWNSTYNIREWYVKFKNKKVYNFLKSLGITERKSATIKLKIPITYNLFRGIFEGDGYIRNPLDRAVQLNVVTASKSLSGQLYLFLKERGFNPILKKRIRSDKTLPLYYISMYRQVELYKLYLNMYKDVPIELVRKKELFGSLVKKFAK